MRDDPSQFPGREPRTIAVDLDDTLNDFTGTLRRGPFPYDGGQGLSEEVFARYLQRVRDDARDGGDLLSTDYSFFRHRIHLRCYGLAAARADGAEFMRWLRSEGWRIVICTSRDLRRAGECTRAWLGENDIPFDHLFMAWNKIAFCRAWGIAHLVDDEVANITHGGDYGVAVYYPLMEKHRTLPAGAGRPFQTFAEVRRWIQE